jgi:DNA-directed RNA polymerase subunit RPC12/RpoP
MQDEAFVERKPLVHCPRCTSRLIYAVDAAGYEAEVILNRRCPECEHRDSVVTSALAAAVWYRRDTRIMRGLMELADSLRESSAEPVAAHAEAAAQAEEAAQTEEAA